MEKSADLELVKSEEQEKRIRLLTFWKEINRETSMMNSSGNGEQRNEMRRKKKRKTDRLEWFEIDKISAGVQRHFYPNILWIQTLVEREERTLGLNWKYQWDCGRGEEIGWEREKESDK